MIIKVNTNRNAWIHTYIHITYINIEFTHTYIYMCVYLFIYELNRVWGGACFIVINETHSGIMFLYPEWVQYGWGAT